MIKNLLVLTLLTWFLPGNAQTEKVYQSRYTLNDVLSLNTDTVYACGDRGIVVSTTNGGVAWQRDSLPTKFSLKSIVVSQKGIGYVVGDSGTVFRSADFGKNWAKTIVAQDYNLSDLQLVNDSMAYVKIEGKGILATSDTGKTWQQVLMLPNLINHLYLGNTGYVASEEKLYRTLNAGKTWDSISFNSWVYVLRVTEKEVLINLGVDLYSSTDTCKTFNLVYTGIGSINNIYTKFQFMGDFGIIARWDLCTCLDPKPPALQMWKTEDNGKTWAYEMNPVSFFGYSFSFVDRNLGYVVGNDGISNGIYKTTTGALGIVVGKEDLIDGNYYKIYPNPIIGTSKIAIPEGTDKITFQLYNALGQMVENFSLSPESNTISKGDKPAGIYVFKIIRIGQVVSTGKLMVQ